MPRTTPLVSQMQSYLCPRFATSTGNTRPTNIQRHSTTPSCPSFNDSISPNDLPSLAVLNVAWTSRTQQDILCLRIIWLTLHGSRSHDGAKGGTAQLSSEALKTSS